MGLSFPFSFAFFFSSFLSSVGKESTCNAEDPGSISGSGRSPGEGSGYPLQYSWVSLVTQLSMGWEDPLETGKAIPTLVFWPGEFHGLYSPWGHKESETTEQLSLFLFSSFLSYL